MATIFKICAIFTLALAALYGCLFVAHRAGWSEQDPYDVARSLLHEIRGTVAR